MLLSPDIPWVVANGSGESGVKYRALAASHRVRDAVAALVELGAVLRVGVEVRRCPILLWTSDCGKENTHSNIVTVVLMGETPTRAQLDTPSLKVLPARHV